VTYPAKYVILHQFAPNVVKLIILMEILVLHVWLHAFYVRLYQLAYLVFMAFMEIPAHLAFLLAKIVALNLFAKLAYMAII
jgi:hypothetical protein